MPEIARTRTESRGSELVARLRQARRQVQVSGGGRQADVSGCLSSIEPFFSFDGCAAGLTTEFRRLRRGTLVDRGE